MKELESKYSDQLNQIAEKLQASEELKKYLEEEEEEDYLGLRNLYEPDIQKVYDEVVEDNPLQIIGFEQMLLEEKFEGMFLPRILGYAVLRGEVNENYKYKKPQDHFAAIVTAICDSSNFDCLKKRIGQTLQMGFALSSDIWITNLINTFANKRIRYFLQSQKLPKYLDPKSRALGHSRYKNQFKNENFYTADFPTDLGGLKVLFSSLKTFILYRAQHGKNNVTLLPEIKAFLSREEFKNTPEYIQMLAIYINFFDLDQADKAQANNLFNTARQSNENLKELWFDFILEQQLSAPKIDAKADARVWELVNEKIEDDLKAYYKLMNTVHTKGYIHDEAIEAVKMFYGNYGGLSDINEAVRKTIFNKFESVISNIAENEYTEYFEISKYFPVYFNIFTNQKFNQDVKNLCMTYVRRLLKRYTDKRGKDYQDIKKFVVANFLENKFLKEKELVELFKTKRKKRTPAS